MWGGVSDYHAMEVDQRRFEHCFWLEVLVLLSLEDVRSGIFTAKKRSECIVCDSDTLDLYMFQFSIQDEMLVL